MLTILIIIIIIIIVGLRAQLIYWALGSNRERGDPRTNKW